MKQQGSKHTNLKILSGSTVKSPESGVVVSSTGSLHCALQEPWEIGLPLIEQFGISLSI